MQRSFAHLRLAVLTAALVMACVVAMSPAALAAAPGNGGNGAAASAGATQDPSWVSLKRAHRVRSGIKSGQAKGTTSTPYTTLTPDVPCCGGGLPSSYELNIVNAVPTTFEPSDGSYPHVNFGTNPEYQSALDDNTHGYNDGNFFKLCGPGAADVALYYWPWPSNYGNWANVVDPETGISTTWNGLDVDSVRRMRGYLVHLAWQIQAPGWPRPGMMEQYLPGAGVRLQEERDGMNWEASGENTSNWSSYFYIVDWNSDFNNNQSAAATEFHDDVAVDTSSSNVPVVPEVNAQLLPNWTNKHNGTQTKHFITVIGYDDNTVMPDGTRGGYYYTDTCGQSTGCGSLSDGGVHLASYQQMSNAIWDITTVVNAGDGGWVW